MPTIDVSRMRDLSLIVLVRHEKGPQACFACLTGAAAANSAVRLVVWSFSPEYLRHSDFAKLFPLQASKQRATFMLQKTLLGYHNIYIYRNPKCSHFDPSYIFAELYFCCCNKLFHAEWILL